METEEWKIIPGYSNRYLASSLGNIKLIAGGKGKNITKILNSYTSNSGYLSVKLWENNRHITKSIHQLIALSFIGECPIGHEVHHIDHNRTNNRPDNLIYIPIPDNRKHHKIHSKKRVYLSPKEIAQVIILLNIETKYKTISDQLNISKTAIYLIDETMKIASDLIK